VSAARRALLLVPPTGAYVREDRCQAPVRRLRTVALRPPTDLLQAGGALERAGWSCRLRDLPAEGAGWPELDRELAQHPPDLLLLSVTTQTLEDDLVAARRAKALGPGVRVLAKGAHFAADDLDRRTLERHPELDGVLRGELELTALELGQGKPLFDVAGLTWREGADPESAEGPGGPGEGTGRVVRNPDRAPALDLDALPWPARHLARSALYTRPDTGEPQATIVTNRGCPFRCIYCLAPHTDGTRNRHRSVEGVVAEIRHCVEAHGIRSFLFRSELFTQNRRWVLRLCRALREARFGIEWACNARVDTVDGELLRAMRSAGCWIVAFGVESGDPDTLERLRKRARPEDALRAVRACREAGVLSSAYLLVGLPWDTPASVEAQARFARELDPDVLEVFYPYPFPGTELRRQVVAAGLLAPDAFPRASYDAPAFSVPGLAADQLARARGRVLRGFYARPGRSLRALRRVPGWRRRARFVRAGLAQLRALAR